MKRKTDIEMILYKIELIGTDGGLGTVKKTP
jgi:hypothetical protein